MEELDVDLNLALVSSTMWPNKWSHNLGLCGRILHDLCLYLRYTILVQRKLCLICPFLLHSADRFSHICQSPTICYSFIGQNALFLTVPKCYNGLSLIVIPGRQTFSKTAPQELVVSTRRRDMSNTRTAHTRQRLIGQPMSLTWGLWVLCSELSQEKPLNWRWRTTLLILYLFFPMDLFLTSLTRQGKVKHEQTIA